MIPGDIDLTENLDFRKTVRKQLPQLPDSWKNNNKNIEKATSYDMTITSSSSYSITSWTNNGGIINYYYDNDSGWFELQDSTYTITDYYYDPIDRVIDYVYEWYGNDEYSIYSNTTYSTSSLSSYKNKMRYRRIKTEDKDIFGNTIIYEEPIPRIPWSNKKIKWYCDDIPWDTRQKNDEEIEPICWECFRDKHWNHWYKLSKRTFNANNPISRAANLICWLFDKTNSFIEDYFDRDNEDVDLSYLTNMHHIRVRDAVID